MCSIDGSAATARNLPVADDLASMYRAYVPGLIRILKKGVYWTDPRGQKHFVRIASPWDAEEIAQDAFVVALRNHRSGAFARDRPFLPYLRGVAKQMALDHARRRARERLVEVTPEAESASQPDLLHEARERAQMVRAFRAALDRQEQIVAERYFVYDDTQQAIAARLNLSRDQIYRLIVRIRQKAADFFSGIGHRRPPRRAKRRPAARHHAAARSGPAADDGRCEDKELCS